ncbi:MAG: hypothetical protein EOO05_14840 [Chitinophagaceae bacterium]|nr:MAG: hypothetical protein EOO05_14840 [Chitinophagaceae bacterium]
MNPKVDAYFDTVKKYRKELEKLRKIALDCGLTEELKWHAPVYTYNGTNLAVIGELSDHFVFSFFKGALLSDPHGILEKPGENTQSARTIRLQNSAQVSELEPVIKAYVFEAIEAEKAGLKVKLKKIEERSIPDELNEAYKKSAGLKKAFESLTPGRQRAYLLHFESAKQSATRSARIEKWIPQIMKGKGMMDR